MTRVHVETSNRRPVSRSHIEIVERKGRGHPDTICDSIAEAVSVALCREYLGMAGHVLHHNIDKMLLVAGQSVPAFGGGRVDAPLRLVVGDRATTSWNGKPIPVWEVTEATIRNWIATNLRFVDPAKHVVLQNELCAGSAELTDIFQRERLVANDTSAAVGSAPYTETERLVLGAERYLNSADFKLRFPFVGEDIKVLGVREERQLRLTVAAAFVDRFIPNQKVYFDQKQAVCDELVCHLHPQLHDLDHVEAAINTLDDPDRGLGGVYLTVLGTSAEGADGGEVGRGNRVSGLISLSRPMSMEAAAGKNPVSHVGKIYNILAHEMAHRIVEAFDAILEANVWLCSQIGHPLAEPWTVSVELVLAPHAGVVDISGPVRALVVRELSQIQTLIDSLVRGEHAVC
ncbi:MAG: methionine adenosyltransferase [Planctomycetales bacterium]|nr:methionine adenosyltransferase [Planctomycetales bacterium]